MPPFALARQAPLDELDRIVAGRPIYAQLHINVDDGLDKRLLPLGPFALYTRNQSAASRREASEIDASARGRIARLLNDSQNNEKSGAEAALVWHDFMRLRHYCDNDRKKAAQEVLESALLLNPGDFALLEIAESCGLSAHGSVDK